MYDTLTAFAYAFIAFAVAVVAFAGYAVATGFRAGRGTSTPVVTVTRATEVELTRAA
jgi:cytochrome bd-type quinol oxidase subunit 2